MSAPRGADRGSEAYGGGGENGRAVLIVEEAPLVRDTLERLLVRRGYHTLTASSAAEALAVAGRYGEAIHVLLMDLATVRPPTTELLQRVGAPPNGTRVVWMSADGYDRHLGHGIGYILEKPFSSSALYRALEETA